MKRDPSVLDRIRVATPCPAIWHEMSGDDRVRYCDSCRLHVYNISEMSRREAAEIIATTEGRICARIYRRADGTMITRDCPVGLLAVGRRLARMATAAAVVLTSICASTFGANGKRRVTSLMRASYLESVNATSFTITATISGSITDPNGAAIPNAAVTLTNLQTNQQHVTQSNKRGQYHFFVSAFGKYSLNVKAPYFQPYSQTVELHLEDDIRLDVSMMISGMMGVIVIEPVRSNGFDIDGTHVRINEP